MNNQEEKNMNTKSLTAKERKALKPMMTDPHKLSQRQKQIDMGKNTLGYEMYLEHVPWYFLPASYIVLFQQIHVFLSVVICSSAYKMVFSISIVQVW